MSRYFISAGIGLSQGTSNNVVLGQQFPLLVMTGPSGNFAQVLPFSGVIGVSPAANTRLHQSELTFSHVSLAWFRNEAIVPFRYSYNTTFDENLFVWQPYGQPSGASAKVNDVAYQESDLRIGDKVMFDGHNWKQVAIPPFVDNSKYIHAVLRIGDGVYWTIPIQNTQQSWFHGVYKGDDPLFRVVGGNDGWDPIFGPHGTKFHSNDNDPNQQIGCDGPQDYEFAGILYVRPGTANGFNIMDMVDWNGTIYAVGQYYMIASQPGGTRGNMIFWDLGITERADEVGESSNYTDRATTSNFGGSLSRSLALHNNELYMLSNNGKVHKVRPGGIREIADLATLGTPWSSGIFGGAQTNSTTSWPGNKSAYRCKLLSYNGQLHAFLNFRTDFRVAKATDAQINSQGKGIFWGTSHDGENWSDRSLQVPTSGIVSASGTGSQELSDWLIQISPYRFSAFTGPNTNDFGASGAFPPIYENTPIGSPNTTPGQQPAQPSGFQQHNVLPYIFTPSGDMNDVPGTSFDQLFAPMRKGPASGHLFPTLIKYPIAFNEQNGILKPSGVDLDGYDYTGCHNYHIAGIIDENDDVMRLIFSEDFRGAAGDFGSTLYFTVNRASGWTRKNELSKSQQLNSFVPCSIFDPEIVIPSGGFNNPNPEVDPINNEVRLKYRLYDWPFWDKVNVRAEYSLDGKDWKNIGNQKQLSTGTKQSDPSGIIGQEHTLVWDYTKDLGKNAFHPSVRIRLRANRL